MVSVTGVLRGAFFLSNQGKVRLVVAAQKRHQKECVHYLGAFFITQTISSCLFICSCISYKPLIIQLGRLTMTTSNSIDSRSTGGSLCLYFYNALLMKQIMLCVKNM